MHRVIGIGDDSFDVVRLRGALKARGWPVPSQRPHYFDIELFTAVARFQHLKGLKVDGICGRETWKALGFFEVCVGCDYQNIQSRQLVRVVAKTIDGQGMGTVTYQSTESLEQFQASFAEVEP